MAVDFLRRTHIILSKLILVNLCPNFVRRIHCPFHSTNDRTPCHGRSTARAGLGETSWRDEDRMSAKAGFPCALMFTVLGLGAAQGADPSAPSAETVLQNPGAAAGVPSMPAYPGTPSSPAMPSPSVQDMGVLQPTQGSDIAAQSGLSSWLRYTRYNCCGPIGAHGPIHTELYAQTGPNLPIGGGKFEHILNTGWDVQGGGRSMFYTADMTGAWTVDLNISYNYNHGSSFNSVPIFETNHTTPVQSHLLALHRTHFTAAAGREWYLYVWPQECGPAWRAGFDVGGGLGTARADFVEIRHRTDVIYRLALAVHTDLEIPRGCCTFLVGFRIEWDHDWMDILQSQSNSNIQDANFLLSLGFRY
jgi:hypothetical protein